jgi:DNA-directed RNA polymerase I, II, and III subunit RPABC2
METEEYVDTKDPEVDGPEEPEDTGEVQGSAKALGITEAPSLKAHGLLEQHPEIMPDYEEEVLNLLSIKTFPPIKEKGSTHTTYPFLTMYERTKILSLRASHLAHGDSPYMEIPEYVTDVYEIAKMELEAKRLPYILKRPLPDGNYEYWRLADLMLL